MGSAVAWRLLAAFDLARELSRERYVEGDSHRHHCRIGRIISGELHEVSHHVFRLRKVRINHPPRTTTPLKPSNTRPFGWRMQDFKVAVVPQFSSFVSV